ncbi:hypothetical protein GCM10011519_25740 [Marmoricola endophyticus]|uniref:SAM-dependent methyltransferase n=1 Tax=Marmoricola endophyticus TaxID=2040280 RepID=A0A917F4W3_9ACTN|nr:class I SAM-dependent methyltransferase [Marmoricola endophyticus]GGF50636.1 hypothetical protein GCM10011519_25740 [Marmoricola endophyticus]
MSDSGSRVDLRPVTPVSLLAAELEELVRTAPPADDRWRERLARAHDLASGLDAYVASVTTPASVALEALEQRTIETEWAGPLEAEMLSGHVEGQLLRTLVRATGAGSVLEIGMFTGYSALAMAQALPAGGRLVACEVDPLAAALATEAFDAAGVSIDVRVGPADRTLDGLAGERFDLVFLDADKAGYLGYLHQLLDLDLLSERALVVVDNTLMQGEPWLGSSTPNGEAVAAFNAAVADDPRVEQVVLPVRDGVTLLMRTEPGSVAAS